MICKVSYSNFIEYLPRRESFHNIFGSWLQMKSFYFGLTTALKNAKQAKVKKDYLSKNSTVIKQQWPSVNFQSSIISARKSTTPSVMCESSENNFDNKPKRNNKKNQSHEELDPDDFFHAVKNPFTNVPKCCVEPYILSGYVLPHRPWRYYFKVLYIPNNETLNVWTHLIPCFCFMWMLYSYSQTIDLLAAWPLLFITVAAIVLTLLSSIAHMFHSRSSYHHSCLFTFDYFGITAFAFSSTVAHFFASSEVHYYDRLGWYNLVVLTLMCSVGFFLCSLSQTTRKSSNTYHRSFKLWSNALGYLYGILPICHRLLTTENDDPGMFYHLLQVLFFISSPAWYMSDIPQKLWPGKFDIVGHSHQIFHIFGALACYFDIRAIHHDVTNGKWSLLNNQNDYPSFAAVSVCALLLVAYCLLVGVYFSGKFKECYREEIDVSFGWLDESATSFIEEKNDHETSKKNL